LTFEIQINNNLFFNFWFNKVINKHVAINLSLHRKTLNKLSILLKRDKNNKSFAQLNKINNRIILNRFLYNLFLIDLKQMRLLLIYRLIYYLLLNSFAIVIIKYKRKKYCWCYIFITNSRNRTKTNRDVQEILFFAFSIVCLFI